MADHHVDTPADATKVSWLRVRDVAELFGVSGNTIRRWTDDGTLMSYRSPGGHRRYLRHEVLAALASRRTRRPGAAVPLPDGDRDELVAALQRRIETLTLVSSVGLDLATTLADDTSAVPLLLAQKLAEVTGASLCEVATVSGDVLRVVASVTDGRPDPSRTGATLGFEPRRLLVADGDGEAARLLTAESHDGPAAAIVAERGCAALVVVPMLADGELLGTVELCAPDLGHIEAQLPVIQGFTRVATFAIKVAATVDLLGQRDRTARALVELAGFASQTSDPDELLEVVAARLSATIDCTGCEIYTLDGRDLLCVAKAERGVLLRDLAGVRYSLDEFPASRAAAEQHRPLVMTDPDDPRLNDVERSMFKGYGIACEIFVPLFSGDRLVGGIDLYDTHSDALVEYLDFITSVGQIVADSMANARLLGDLARQNTLMAELVELGVAASGTSDLSNAFETLGQRLLATTGADTCEIYAVSGDRMTYLAGFDTHGPSEEYTGWTDTLASYPLTASALAAHEVLIVCDRDDPRLSEHEGARLDLWNFRSEICVPLVVGDEPIGFIDIYDTRPRDYAEFADFLRGVAPVLARTLQNSVLLRDLERRNLALKDLVTMGEASASITDLDELLRIVALRVYATLDPEYCEIYRCTGDEMMQLVSIGPDGFDTTDDGWRYPLEHYPQFATAMGKGEPWIVESPDDPRLGDWEREWYLRWGIRCSLTVPLMVDGEPIAVIDVEDKRDRDLSQHVDFMLSIAQLLSGAFEKGFLLDRLERGNQELRRLVDVGLELGASLELDQVLDTAAQRLCQATGADCCDIYEVVGDEEHGLVSTDGQAVDPEFRGTVYPLGEMYGSRWATERREPFVIDDVTVDDRITEFERSEWLRFDFRSGVTVPLITGAEVVGFATVYAKAPGHFKDVTTARGLAQIAAQAIANARLHARIEATAHRMTIMTEAAMDFASSLDFEQTLVSVAKRLCAAIDVPSCDINLVEGDGTRCILSVTDGQIDPSYVGAVERFEQAPLLKRLVETRQPLVFESRDDPRLTAFSRTLSEHWNERSWVQVPLVAKDRVIGVATLSETRRERAFSDEEIATAQTICQAAAMALANADLFADLQRSNRETELLNTIASRAAASLDMREIAHAAADELLQLVAARRRALLLFEGGLLQTAFASEPRMHELEGLPVKHLDERFLNDVRESGVVSLTLPDERPLGLPEHWVEGMRSMAVVGMFTDEHLVGLLVLLTDRADAYPDHLRGFLDRVGTQLSLAIKNARLYEDIKRMHVNNLKALSSALNAKDYYTLGHAARVSAYTVLLGEKLGWPEELVRGAEEAAYLHDIGKIGISDRVLLKPGKLNAEEWQLMRMHPVFSADIIGTLFNDDLVLGVRYHHERFDGKGYPNGLKGEDIPMIARAMCVVDSYDAMSFQRPYRQALDEEECLEELRRCRGRQFDPAIVDAFLEVLEDLDGQRRVAQLVAAEAARRIDPGMHARLVRPEDEDTPAYAEIAATLREVRDTNPPTVFLTTQARLGRRYVLIVDPEEDPQEHSPLGSDIFPDEVLQVLPKVLAGQDPHVNALFADQFGVWVTGLAPIVATDGSIEAVVAADLAPFSGAEQAGLRNVGKESLASILQSAAVRSQRAEIDAITDGLTGLYNHRYLHERLSEEIRRSGEADSPLSLLFCDLDLFKEFNEDLGHRAGDNALRAVAHVLEQSIRAVDLAARYGGEEFVVALIETDAAGAFEVAERIRERLHETWVAPSQEPLSVSIGVSTFPADGTTKEELLDKADWAMHVAKRQGRNRVVAFAPGKDEHAE